LTMSPDAAVQFHVSELNVNKPSMFDNVFKKFGGHVNVIMLQFWDPIFRVPLITKGTTKFRTELPYFENG